MILSNIKAPQKEEIFKYSMKYTLMPPLRLKNNSMSTSEINKYHPMDSSLINSSLLDEINEKKTDE